MNIFQFLIKNTELRKKLAEKLWPDQNDHARGVSISKLVNGGVKTIKVKWVRLICEVTGRTPNQLFGYPWKQKSEKE